MDGIETLLDDIYQGQERRSRDEVLAALAELSQEPDPQLRDELGVPAIDLSDDDLVRELAQLHRTRHETLRHGSAQALVRHSERLGDLEAEYISRFPLREVEPDRLRSAARDRS